MSSEITSGKTLLVAPLDWGLGHATRCIPIIRSLSATGNRVLIGAEGKQAALLREEFPALTILPLPGYGIRYTAGARGFGLKMAAQLPKIRRAIRREHHWLRALAETCKLDAVISDNRFGLHLPGIPSVIMTHQLLVKSPFGGVTEKWLQKINYHYLEQFDRCWVVDFEGENNLAGALSHPEKLPGMPVSYLGALSRFTPKKEEDIRRDLLAVISGPEPQRSFLEELLLKQICASGYTALIVTGKPGEQEKRSVTPAVDVVNHLNSGALNEAILQSQTVICRSGYTSIMDLIKLRKKAILIPTPGQPEQEYLGSYLMKKGYLFAVSQHQFKLDQVLRQAASFPYRFPNTNMEVYRETLTTITR